MANPNIFAQYAQPLRSVADYSNEMARGEFLDNQNAMQRAAMQQGQQQQQAAAARQNALAALANETGGDPDKMVRGLYQRGFVGEAQALEKHRADIGKTGADAGKASAEAAAKQAETRWKEVDRLAQELAFVKTPEDVVAYAQRGAQVMGLSPEQAQQAVQKALSYPSVEAYVADAQRQAIPLVKQFEEQAAMARSRLQADTSIATNAATNATSRANNAASVGASYANAAAQREIARSQFDANQVSRDLQNQRLKGEIEEKQRGKQAGISSAANQIAVIDKALTHPGRETATGLSGTADPRNYVPGTDAADFRAVLDQIGGAAFLQAFESLKGGGQITEVEGKKATDAMARLSRAQSDAEFKKSLQDLRQVMTAGYKRLSGEDYKGAAPAQSASGAVLKFDKDGNPVK